MTTRTEPPQVGDWWMCQECGTCGHHPPWHQSPSRCRLHGKSCLHLRLCSEDWLRCRNVAALGAMIRRFRRFRALTSLVLWDEPPPGMTEAELRCIFGNPFHPWTPSPEVLAWRDGTVRRVAAKCIKKSKCVRGTWLTMRNACFEYESFGPESRWVKCSHCQGRGFIESITLTQRRNIPILADALEEAGESRNDVLRHLREPGEHSSCCFVLRAILEG